MKYILVMVMALLVSGCDSLEPLSANQALRSLLFKDCLNNLPAGPQSTHYNDWSEVVSECENSAYYRSLRRGGRLLEEDKLLVEILTQKFAK